MTNLKDMKQSSVDLRSMKVGQVITNQLQEKGLEAKNPDQSRAHTSMFRDTIESARLKGFSEKDIKIMFQHAVDNEVPDDDEGIETVMAGKKDE